MSSAASSRWIKALGGIAALTVGLIGGTWAAGAARPARSDVMPETELWKRTIHSPLPSFPRVPLEPGMQIGVVSRISHDTKGVVTDVRVLDSVPDPFKTATETALREWRFLPQENAGVSKVTIYFAVENGLGVVSAPGMGGTAVARQAETRPAGTKRPTQTESPAVTFRGWKLPASVKVISEAEFEDRLGRPDTIAIDVRTPDQFRKDGRKGVLNIPVKDLTGPASDALKGKAAVLLDCTKNQSDACVLASISLARFEFREIAICGAKLDASSKSPSS